MGDNAQHEPLRAAAASIEDISEDLRPLYKQAEDGVWLLDVAPVEMSLEGRTRYYNLEDVGGLTATLNEVKAKRDKLQNKLAEYDGISALDAKSLKHKVSELSALDPETEAEKIAAAKMDGLRQNMQSEFDAALRAAQEREDLLKNQLEKQMITAEAIKAIAENKGSPELLLGVIKERTRMRETDTGYAVEVLDGAGNPAVTLEGTQTRPQTIPELVRGLKNNTAYARAFDSDNIAGSESSSDATRSVATQVPDVGGSAVIPLSDSDALGESLEALASGEATVDFDH